MTEIASCTGIHSIEAKAAPHRLWKCRFSFLQPYYFIGFYLIHVVAGLFNIDFDSGPFKTWNGKPTGCWRWLTLRIMCAHRANWPNFLFLPRLIYGLEKLLWLWTMFDYWASIQARHNHKYGPMEKAEFNNWPSEWWRVWLQWRQIIFPLCCGARVSLICACPIS